MAGSNEKDKPSLVKKATSRRGASELVAARKAAARQFEDLVGDLGHGNSGASLSYRMLEAIVATKIDKSGGADAAITALTSSDVIGEILTVSNLERFDNPEISDDSTKSDMIARAADFFNETGIDRDKLDDVDVNRRLILTKYAAVAAPTLSALARPMAARNLEPALRFGPFRDRFDRDFFVDMLQPAKKLALRSSLGASPLLLATKARLSGASQTKVVLQKGTVWLAASSLHSSAPANEYIGIRVNGGTIEFAAKPARQGDDFILASSNISYRLKLDVWQKPAGSSRISALPPKQLELHFDPSASVGNFHGTASIDDIDFKFQSDGTVRRDIRRQRMIFKCQVEPVVLDTARIERAGAAFEGEVGSASGGWAVPITLPGKADDLGEAAGESLWVVTLSGDFHAKWQGGPPAPVTIEKAELVIQDDAFAVDASQASPKHKDDSHHFRLWHLSGSSHKQRLAARLDAGFEAVLGWNEAFGPITQFEAHCSYTFDRPLRATGDLAAITESDVLVLILGREDAQQLLIVPRSVATAATAPERQMLVLENAFLSVDALRFGGLIAKLRNGVETYDGYTAVVAPLLGWLPILPDPYVDNLCPGREALAGQERRSNLLGLFAWKEGEATFEFFGLMPGLSSKICAPSKGGSGPMRQTDNTPDYNGQTAQGSLPRHNVIRSLASRDIAAGRLDARTSHDPGVNTAVSTPSEVSIVAQRRFAELENRSGLTATGPMLLDVSTARHQIGVKLPGSNRGKQPDRLTAVGQQGFVNFVIYRSRLGSSLANLQVFALPQIQWEPVRTLEKDQDLITLGLFPSPLASPDDGGATVIGSNTVRLAATIPDLVLNEVLQAFDSGQPFGIVTTLPFGIKTLFRVRSDATTTRLPDSAEYVRPRFAGKNALEGGLQLSVRSEGGIDRPGRESPSFEGLAIQTLNGVDLYSGTPLNISVLGATAGSAGSVESLFNNEFSNLKPRVPITRYDISGYGASTFSDWANPKGSFAETTRAQFQVMVGRTALEIIKVASVLYPWGIRVTRSVTIERKGGGGVLRRDSGWQAQSGGIFDFTTDSAPDQPFEIHPGLIRGLFNISRIRPLANEGINLPGGKVLPMAFDADVELEGRVGGGLTLAKGLVGYLHLEPLGTAISPAALAALIANQGPIGGPVDDIIDVGGSGFKSRALRIEIDVAPAPFPAPGGFGFIGAVRTAPRFSSAGSWAVVQASSPGGPGPHDATGIIDGAPIIREGKAQPSPDGRIRAPLTGAYRFASARDLFDAANPQIDYGFMQSDTTHRFLFRRPKIEAGTKEVTSALPPVFVDFFAATSSKGLFPPADVGIQLTDQPYRLDVDQPSGFLALVPDVVLSAPRGELILSDSGTDRFRIAYGGSDLRFGLSANDWDLEFNRVELWTDAGGWPELNGTRVTLRGGQGRRSELDNIQTLMSPVMEDLLSILPFMNDRGTHGPVDLGASNVKVSLKFSAGVDVVFPGDNPYVAIRLFALVEMGIDNKLGVTDEALFLGGKTGYEARFSIPIEPYPVAVIFGWGLTLGGKVFLTGPDKGKTKGLVEIRIYVGLAFGKDLGPFKATVATGAGLLIVGGSESGLGGFIFLEIQAKITPIVKIKVYGEFACLQITKSDGKKYHRWQGHVGINVSIFMIISIKFQAEVSDEKPI